MVSQLQAGYGARAPQAVASLARLRRAVNVEPGSDPDVWEETLGGLPSELLGRGNAPSPSERAAHSAVTLFAVHMQGQQGRDVHVSGRSLGAAVAQLRDVTADPGAVLDPVTRRFLALSTASTQTETLHHLRGLVTQLRGAVGGPIGLDYGLLAVALRRLQDPRLTASVRLQWGRDYYDRKRLPADTLTNGDE